MKITIWSDFVCPFCFIGQAHMDRALESFEHADRIEIEYKSYILSPDEKYVPGQDYYQAFANAKGISLEETNAMFHRIADMGRDSGLDIHFSLAKNANTYDAHRVLQYAKEIGRDAECLRRFYEAHFSEGEVISDHGTIIRLAGDIGIDSKRVRQILESNAYAGNVEQDLLESRLAGVSSVPYFLFNDKYSLSGAQPVQELIRVLDQVWKEEQAVP
jgi:predicted DsbA family dithiol-disulfide isomerase